MSLPIVLITGQLLTDAVWQPLRDAWTDREVIVADNRSDDCIEGFAQRLLDDAPPKFVLIAHAMGGFVAFRSEEHTSELQSLMRNSYAVFCLKKKKKYNTKNMTK